MRVRLASPSTSGSRVSGNSSQESLARSLVWTPDDAFQEDLAACTAVASSSASSVTNAAAGFEAPSRPGTVSVVVRRNGHRTAADTTVAATDASSPLNPIFIPHFPRSCPQTGSLRCRCAWRRPPASSGRRPERAGRPAREVSWTATSRPSPRYSRRGT